MASLNRIKIGIAVLLCAALLSLNLLSNTSSATETIAIRVGVAANFRTTLEQLIGAFKPHNPDIEIRFSSAASGSLYHQIIHGAPFDLFLSADSRYPAELERHASIQAYQRATYALGELVLYNPLGSAKLALLNAPNRVAIANPKLAPYGRAGQEVLAGITEPKAETIIGQSIAQAYQYAITGNVDAALVAKSLVVNEPEKFLPLKGRYRPIAQQAVLIDRNQGPALKAAQRFYAFIQSPNGQQLIQASGYGSESLRRKAVP